MPRYFFHIVDGSRTTDTEGVELRGPAEARSEAIRVAGQTLKDCPEAFWGSRPWSVTVTDHAGLILYEVATEGYSSPAGDALGLA